jgi:transposase
MDCGVEGDSETVPITCARALVILEHARTRGIKPTAARFGLNCKTARRWRDRWKAAGVEGLIARYPKRRARPTSDGLRELIHVARQELHYGSTRTQLGLWRRHRVRVAQSTIQRVVRELGLPPVHPARKRRHASSSCSSGSSLGSASKSM